jgi:hypothetical protein
LESAKAGLIRSVERAGALSITSLDDASFTIFVIWSCGLLATSADIRPNGHRSKSNLQPAAFVHNAQPPDTPRPVPGTLTDPPFELHSTALENVMRFDAKKACPRYLPRRVAKHEERLLQRISSSSFDEEKRRLVLNYLRSNDAHLVAAYEAFRRHGRPLVKIELVRIAEALNPWRACEEPVRVFVKMKPNGDHRTLQQFGIENRARHCLISRALRATRNPHPYQYGSKGVPAAIAQAAKWMKEGYLWCAEVDIKNCFPSFEEEQMSKYLLLPKEVISHSVMGEHLNHKDGNLSDVFSTANDGSASPCTTDVLAEARQGLPQGSVASSIVSEVLLSTPLNALPGFSVAVNYVDNTLLMAKTEGELNKTIEAFGSALKAHPVGSFKLKIQSYCAPGNSIEFLGHSIALVKAGITMTPTNENKQKCHVQIKLGLKRMKLTKLTPFQRRREFHGLKSYVSSWCSNFTNCDGMKTFRSSKLAQIINTYEHLLA